MNCVYRIAKCLAQRIRTQAVLIGAGSVFAAVAPAQGQLLLTEVQSNQASSGVNDYWELTNAGSTSVDLSNWKWDDDSRSTSDPSTVTIPSGTTIAAGESIIFTALSPSAFRTWWGLSSSVKVVQGSNAPGLGQNDGIALFNSSGTEVFYFSYAANGFTRSNGSGAAGGHAGASGGGGATQALVLDPTYGSSIPRYTAATVGTFGAFASAASASDIGSPGYSGLTIPVALTVSVTPATFGENAGSPAATGTVTRTGSTAASLVVNLTSSDTTEATVPATVTILAGQTSASFDVAAVDDNIVDGSQTATITAAASGATSGTFDLTVTDQGDAAPITLIITEVQSNQASSGVNDYWELTNYGDAAIDLSNWKWDDDSRNPNDAAAVTIPAGTTIAAGESIILTVVAPSTFRSWWNINSSVQVISATAPGLGGSDALALFNSSGVEMLFFSYGAGGFTKSDGTASIGGHAGLSAGGVSATQALVLDPRFGVASPRYTAATVGKYKAFASAGNAADIGSPGVTGLVREVDLSQYIRVGRYDLPEPTRTTPPNGTNLLCQEASGVAYDWDTDTLFITGDGGTSITQVSKTGVLIDTMTLAPGSSPQGTDFYDPEGITYVGNGQFVFSEERDRQLVRCTYAAGTTLSRAGAKTVKIGTFVPNTGTEGLSWDPQTGGFICLKEIDPMGLFQTNVDFDAGTATNGSPTTENSVNLFNPALTGQLDFADVFALSNIPALSGRAQSGNLLVLSQESANIVNVDRSGNISSTLTIVSDAGNPLSAAAQQDEGLTMDREGYLYVVNENGGGDADHPQLWVYAPSSVPNQAPTAVALNNAVTSLPENTNTSTHVKVADIAVTDDGLGTNALTLSGADASYFEIAASALYIRAGTVLDFETKTSYSLTVDVDDASLGSTPDATVDYTLAITDVAVETPSLPPIIISEVAAWSSGNSPVAADWFELTNTSSSTVDITGWKMDDSSNSFASAVALSGITSIAPGESVIFLETSDLAGVSAQFVTAWFNGVSPAGLRFGNYSGSGVGLSTGSDAVNIYNAAGVLQANVAFGASPAGPDFATFNNAAGLNNTTISTLSVAGTNAAIVAANDSHEIGSPGTVGKLFISEVAPWSSGNSPVSADWFEVTNTTAFTIDLTGWKMDDNSESFAAAVALNGISSIAPGESVIYLETADLPSTSATFKSTWFGASPPAGLQIGSYTGSGVGLSTGSDAVNLYNSTGVQAARVSFGAAPGSAPYTTFDNAAALNLATISQFSAIGVNGAFAAVNDGNEVGSPGTVSTPLVTTATVSIGNASVIEGNSGTVVLHLPVTRTNTQTAFSVDFAVTGGTASSGTDYVAVTSGAVTFAAGGAGSQTIDITVNGDGNIESSETIEVTLSNVVNTAGSTTIATAVGTGTITNDDFATVPLTQATLDVKTPDTGIWPAGGVMVNGTQFVNLGLQGVGRVAASMKDPVTGESVGSISDMQISGWTKNVDGTYSGTFNFLPDRGYNSGVIYSNYAARINEFTFNFTPYTSSTPTADQNQIAMTFAGSTRFTYDHDGNAGTAPIFTTGLFADSQVNLFGGPVPTSSLSATQSDGTFANRLTIDSEGLILDKRAGKSGSGWVSDEYGPYIYHFNSSKEIDGWLQLPSAVLPHAPAGTVSFVDTNVNGRRTNQGMEGIAQSPSGRKLFGLMQSATLQDSASGNQGRFNTRLLVYDLSGGDTPGDPEAQYLIQLPRVTSAGNGGAVDRTAAQSSVLALNDHQLLILSRDGNGRGATGSPVFKSILLAELDGATNFDGDYDGEGTGPAPAGVLNPSVTPISWTEALNLIGKLDGADAEVAKFGLNLNAAPGDLNSISEKWEAIELVPANDPANPNDFFLFVGNDNDFLTGNGKYMDANGVLQTYDGGLENDTLVLAYRVRVVAPDIAVFAGTSTAATELADGQATATPLGTSAVGENASATFTIQNTGTSELTGLTVTIDGADAADFSVETAASAPVSAGATTMFVIKFAPASEGAKSAALHIASNAPGAKGDFDIPISGTATPAPAAGAIAFDNLVYSVDQGATSVTITVTRTGGTAPVAVTVDTNDGTASTVPPIAAAIAGTDYVDLSGANRTLDFAEGETSKDLTVTLVPKTASNTPNKQFELELSSPTGGATLGLYTTAAVQILANDTTKPILTVTAPTAAAAAISGPLPYVVRGTAGDAKGLDRVEVVLNSGAPLLADVGGSTSNTSQPFTLSINPVEGPNTLVVTAYDLQGNSTAVTRNFSFTRRYMLTVTRNAPVGVALDAAGLVTQAAAPAKDASPLQPAAANANPKSSTIVPGTTVKLTAVARPGYVFSHWSGLPTGTDYQGNVVTFTMPSQDVPDVGMTFVENPFLTPAGQSNVFYGHIHAAVGTPVGNATEGYLTGTMIPTSGIFSGRVMGGGLLKTFVAYFYGNGTALFGATVKTPVLEVSPGRSLTLSFVDGSISATLISTDGTSIGSASRGIYSASNKVDGSLLNTKIPASAATNTRGVFTVSLPAKAQTPAVEISSYPQGDGYVTVTMTDNGTLSLAGLLADGTTVTASSALVADDRAPIFAQLVTPGGPATNKGGSFGGILAFDATQADSDVSGTDLLWIRPAVTAVANPAAAAAATNLYTDGWPSGIRVDAVGALYDKTITIQAALGAGAADGTNGNAKLTFTNGKLVSDVEVTRFNVVDNKVTKIPVNNATFTLTPIATTGIVTGSFTPNWSSPNLVKPAFKGILIQKGASKGGFGYFISNVKNDLDPESGGVTLSAQ